MYAYMPDGCIYSINPLVKYKSGKLHGKCEDGTRAMYVNKPTERGVATPPSRNPWKGISEGEK